MRVPPEKLMAFDVETHLIQPGLRAPPLVCASVAFKEAGSERLIDKIEARKVLRDALVNETAHIVGANLVYDLGVMCNDTPALMPLVFKALEEGRLHSTDILEALHDNAFDRMFFEPETGQPFRYYSLAQLEKRYFGTDRFAEKENGWRKRYAELDGVPLEQWPDEAVEYPRKDARGTWDIGNLQLNGEDRQNVQCEAAEMRAAWFLHLACIWGMRTDSVMVDAVVERILEEHKESRRLFFDSGLVSIRPIKKVKGEWERADDEITEEWLKQAWLRLHQRLQTAEDWHYKRKVEIEKALASLKAGRPLRWMEDRERIKNLVRGAYNEDPPLTSGGKSGNRDISISRDTLVESGNDLLEKYGEAGPNEKLLSTYVNVLRQGTKVPICPEVNTIVKTQRTSYREPNLQQLPRHGGIRECFVPRAGSVLCSCDYATLELCSLSQVCINMFGESAMGEAINAGQDLHTRLGGAFLGVGYDEAIKLKKAKDSLMLALRQAAKPVGFGIPGLMGPPKIVSTARKDGVRFCELARMSERCSDNPRTTVYAKRTISPTCEVCLSLAAKYRDIFYQTYPEVRRYHEFTIEQARRAEQGLPLTSFGTGMLRLETSANAVSNHFFQNLAAQGAKHAGWKLALEAYTDKKSVLYRNMRTVVFVHDEAITEIKESVAHEAAYRQAEIMMQAMQEFIPDVKITVKPALMRRWFKGADDVHDKDGKLKPWWPEPEKWTWEADQKQMALDNAR